ncbi:MAG: hypothetical protein ACF8SC_08650 [Phycisphaerales bacterium JB037]
MRNRSYTNGVLSAIAVLLGLVVLGQHTDRGSAFVSEAGAAGSQPNGGGLVSAASQRKEMIAALKEMSQRLAKMEAKLNSGLDVDVRQMPPIKLPANAGGGE